MLTTLLLLCALAQQPLLPGAAKPAPPPRKVAPPRLAIEPAGRVNLGSIGPAEVRTQVYTLKNTSEGQIAVRVLDLSPGVTVAGPALQGPIAPKGSAQLTLRVDPAEFVGWQPRNVKLGTDDPGQGEYFLPIGMTVRPDLSVDRVKQSFGEVAPHESPQLTFRFRRETGQATKLWVSSPLPPYLEVEAESVPGQPQEPAAAKPGEPGSEGALRVTLRPGQVEPGMRAGLETLTVESSAPLQPRFQLYLDWKLKLPVTLSAPRIVFLTAGETSRKLVIEGRDGRSFQLQSARLEGEGFELGKVPAKAVRRAELDIRRTSAVTARAVLLLHLKGEPEPIRVPVAYLPPEKAAPPPG